MIMSKLQFWSVEPLAVFIPTVEKETALNKNPFITDTPQNILKKGKFHPVPLMIGAMLNEGLLRAARKFIILHFFLITF